jgi:hypothetical protein
LIFRLSIPIPVLGAICVAVIVGAVLFRLMPTLGKKPAMPQSAELHLPATSTEPMPAAPESESVMRSAPMPAPSAAMDGSAGETPLDQPLSYEHRKELAPPSAHALPPAAPAVQDDTAAAEVARAEKDRAAEVPAAQEELKSATAAPPRADREQAARMKAGAPPAALLGGSIQAQSGATASRIIGDKEFYPESGIWIDRQCAGRQGEPIIEIAPPDPEYEAILARYKELRNLRPAKICWNSRIYLLR